MKPVSSGYFRSIGIPLLAGRPFERSDHEQRTAAAVLVGAVLKQGVVLLLVGIGLGLLGTTVLGSLIETLLYEVHASDPLTTGAVVLVVAGIGLLAAWLPARRAARVDPARALRPS